MFQSFLPTSWQVYLKELGIPAEGTPLAFGLPFSLAFPLVYVLPYPLVVIRNTHLHVGSPGLAQNLHWLHLW